MQNLSISHLNNFQFQPFLKAKMVLEGRKSIDRHPHTGYLCQGRTWGYLKGGGGVYIKVIEEGWTDYRHLVKKN